MVSQHKEAEVTFFNTFGTTGYEALSERGYRRLLSYFEKLVKPKPGEMVIDLGCGSGTFANRLLAYGLRVHGIDISDECINYARKTFPDATFEVGDIEHLAQPDNSVDIAMFSGVLHHFPDFRPTVREAFRVLKPGGRLFAFDPNRHNPAMWLYRVKSSPFYSSKGVTENEQPLSRRALTAALTDCSFAAVNCYGITGITLSYIEGKSAQLLMYPYNVFEPLLGMTPLTKKIGSFLITYAEKPR